MNTADLPILLLEKQAAWHNWLAEHHGEQAGIWLKFAKKNSGAQSLSYSEAVEEALCFGWIDGQSKSFDETYWLQKFTPRRARSIWSKINVGKVDILSAAGKMQPAGLAAVEAAKKDGRWDAAYSASSTMEVPADFQAELDKNPKAKAFFETLNKTNRFAFCWRVQTAKKPETRSARIEKFIAMLANSEKLY